MVKQRTGNKSSKFRSQKPQNSKNTKNLKSKNGVKKRTTTNRIQDARQKIIQKKRKTVVDAREILSKMAKSRDARLKIDRIRDGRTTTSPGNTVKAISSNILKKTDRNGRISLITNKSKQKSDMNVTIQKQLGLIPNSRSPMRRSTPKRQSSISVSRPVSIRKMIQSDMDYFQPPADSLHLYDPTLYKWTKPDLRPHPASHLISSLETRQVVREAVREELNNEWPTFATHRYSKSLRPFRFQPQPTGFINLVDQIEDEEMPLARTGLALQGTSRVSNVRSRLDGLPQQESHGIFSQKAKVVVPAGHRIVVSNLQPTVTQDDIKELFEDIGQLLAAKLVRPGVAEVIYKNLKDAQKAVDTYHNRQLDGQPMKCLLVNKRPLNHPTAPAIKTETPLRKIPTIPPCPPSNKLVPDIDTIHKVLFQRK